jgi:hypothetical protein
MLVKKGRFATVVFLSCSASFGIVMRSDISGLCGVSFLIHVIVDIPIEALSLSFILCYENNTFRLCFFISLFYFFLFNICAIYRHLMESSNT